MVGTGLTLVSTGDLTLSATGNINANNEYINNLAEPLQNQDAATKLYVDNAVTTGFTFHAPVLAATNTTLDTATSGVITYTQPNGVANGVGATLTTTGSFNLIDTANIQTIGTRVLVKDQANAVQNGIYTWANATAIVRSTDADQYGSSSTEAFGLNDYFYVQSGNVNAGAAYIVSAPAGVITFGTSNITFAEFSKSQVYSANTSAGISLTGTVISALVDNVTTAFSTGNIVVKTSAQLTTPNIGDATGTSLSVTGNITGGNLSGTSIVGTLTTAAQTNITSVGTLGSLTVTANTTSGNLLTGGLISATGNITGGNILGGANVNATTHTGTTVSVSANVTGGNILTAGLISATGNITGGNVLGGANVNATTHTGGTVNVTGNIDGGNLRTGGLISATGNITGGNLSGTSIVGTLTTAAQTNITSVGTLTSLAVTGNISGGNLSGTSIVGTLTTAAQTNITSVGTLSSLAVTANISGGNFVGTLNGSGANVTSISATNISSGTLDQARLANASVTLGSTALTLGSTVTTVAGLTSVTSTTFVGALTGAATTAGTVTTAAQPNITSVGTLSSLTVSGNSTQANINLTTNSTSIRQTSTAVWSGDAASGQGKLEYHSNRWYVNAGGDSTLVCQFRRGATDVASVDNSGVYSGTATTAKYADLAENYSADDVYASGTVLVFGGANEVTVANMISDPKVAGVVSTNPAHLMNSVMEAEHIVAVALTGRVPTKVIGPVKKGDMMVSSINGRAQACATPAMGTVIGKALQDFDGESGTIEIVVGRL